MTLEALRNAFTLAVKASGAFQSVTDDQADRWRCEVRTRGGNSLSVQIDDLYADCLSVSPEEREALVLQHLAGIVETARQLDGALAAPTLRDVVPTVKGAEWIAESQAKVADLASEPLAGDLFLVYAFDLPHTVAFARWSELDPFRVSQEHLRETALGNLRARLPRKLGTRGDGKSFLFVAGGNHEASLILEAASGSLVVRDRDELSTGGTKTVGRP